VDDTQPRAQAVAHPLSAVFSIFFLVFSSHVCKPQRTSPPGQPSPTRINALGCKTISIPASTMQHCHPGLRLTGLDMVVTTVDCDHAFHRAAIQPHSRERSRKNACPSSGPSAPVDDPKVADGRMLTRRTSTPSIPDTTLVADWSKSRWSHRVLIISVHLRSSSASPGIASWGPTNASPSRSRSASARSTALPYASTKKTTSDSLSLGKPPDLVPLAATPADAKMPHRTRHRRIPVRKRTHAAGPLVFRAVLLGRPRQIRLWWWSLIRPRPYNRGPSLSGRLLLHSPRRPYDARGSWDDNIAGVAIVFLRAVGRITRCHG